MSEEISRENIEKALPMSPIIIALVAGVFIISALVLVYVNMESGDAVVPIRDNTSVSGGDTTVAAPAESLGGEIYEKTQNPLQDKLPEQTPVANPLGDAYKNPFE